MIERAVAAHVRWSLPHIPALDGLRGLAVLGILLFHAGHLPGGWLGVDLFFVLSGFLITSLLLQEFEATRGISLRSFWARRARRLLPALVVALFGVSAYAALVAQPQELERIRADGFATLFYVANWHAIFSGHEYWDLFIAPSPLEHTWSLAIEEQFYLVWPIFALVTLRAFRGSRRALGFSALLLATASALSMALLYDSETGTARVYYGTDTRCFAPLLGAALAAATRGRLVAWSAQGSSRSVDALGLVAALTLAWAWASLDGNDPRLYHGGLFLLSMIASTTTAAVVLVPRGWTSRAFQFAPLRGLGVVSYAVYLWHWPLYLLIDPERTGLDGWTLTALRITASVGVAVVSYALVERPVRRGALTGLPAKLVGIGAAGAICLALIAATGMPSEIPMPDRGKIARPGGTLLIGDSMALMLAEAFEAEGVRRGLTTKAIAGIGCMQLRSERVRLGSGKLWELSWCREVQRRWKRWVVENRPRRVLVLEASFAGAASREISGEWYEPCEPEYAESYARDLRETAEFLRRYGVEPVLLTTPPPWVEDLNAAVVSEFAVGPENLGPILRADSDCHNRVRRQVARAMGVPMLDLESWVCPGGICLHEVDGRVLRPDGLHFLGAGAESVSRWLLDQVEQLP